ncbi:MAG: GyrI-like domain-containing protein [Candidatus Avoscillospira sp.]
MNYQVEVMDAFSVIGFEKVISNETAFRDCPAFWAEFQARYMQPILAQGGPKTELEQAVCDNGIGEFGVCVCLGENNFRYLVAGAYRGGPVPEGLVLHRFPAMTWLKFTTQGPMPRAIQTLNKEIFSSFLPSHPEWELAAAVNAEWYSMGDTTSDSYESGIWVPVREKS